MHNSFSMLGKIAELTETLARNPRSTVFVSLAEAYRRMGLLDDALEIAAKGSRSLPDYGPGHLAIGRIQIQKGNLAEAAQALETVLTLDGGNLPALKNLARIRLKQGDKKRAGELLGKAASLKPDDPEIGKLRQVCAPAAAREEASGETAETARVAEKTDPISTPTLAEIYIRQGFYKRAMKIYWELLKKDPDNAEIRQKLASLKRRIESEENQESPGDGPPQNEAGAETPAPVAEAPLREDGPLESFDRWLGAIQRRREDVR